MCLHWTAVSAVQRVAGYWHMLPEYAQARKAIWAAVNPHTGKRRIDEAFPHVLRRATRENEMMIVLRNGSTWQVVGSDRYDSLVGSSPAGIVYSEWALSNPSARAYFRPILAENGGWQIFNTTPRGRNHALTTLNAARQDPQAFAQVLDATQTGIFTPQALAGELANYLAEFGEDYGRSRFEQEYLCSFDAANLGAILARQIGIAEQQGRISDDVRFDPLGQALEISADIGRRDSATWWFWQPQVGGYQIVDSDAGFGLDAEAWARRLRARWSIPARRRPAGAGPHLAAARCARPHLRGQAQRGGDFRIGVRRRACTHHARFAHRRPGQCRARAHAPGEVERQRLRQGPGGTTRLVLRIQRRQQDLFQRAPARLGLARRRRLQLRLPGDANDPAAAAAGRTTLSPPGDLNELWNNAGSTPANLRI